VTAGSSARRTRRAAAVRIGAAFLVNGVTATVWLAATPAIAARLGTTVAGFGTAFVALALGGIAGTRAAPAVLRRLGSGPTTVLAGFLLAGGLALRALPHALAWFVAAQLAAGFVDGVHDVAMNVEAVAVDAQKRMPIVNRLHSVWSLGAVAGGLLGTALASASASVPVLFLVAAAVVATVNLVTLPLVRSHEVSARSARGRPAQKWWRSPVLVALAVMGIAGSILEGAPLDWGALFLTDVVHARPGVAAAATVTFTTGMVVSRLVGDHLIHRFGVPAVLRVGASAAAVALGTALLADHATVVLVAWAVVGAGVAASYPALFVAAGRAPGLAAGVGIGAVSSVARTGFLIGPALIGMLADHFGLRWALAVPVVAALFIVILAGAAQRPSRGMGDDAP
jgi:MFS family permease